MMSACRICGNTRGNRIHTVPEMMFGTGKSFEYRSCGRCGCLQIVAVPADLSTYYPEGYYSLRPRRGGLIRTFFRRARARHAAGKKNTPGLLAMKLWGAPSFANLIAPLAPPLRASVLDVGCGSGWLIEDMMDAGFIDLTGIDPHLDQSIVFGDGVRAVKGTLSDLDRTFDLILFNDSLEHMADQRAALEGAALLLAPGGTIMVRTPLAGSAAWEEYGTDWVQFDAPRHLVVHTPASLGILAGDCGLIVERTVFDSDAFQFWGSEQYRRGIPLVDKRSYAVNPRRAPFGRGDIRAFEARAAALNREGRGDSARFYLRRRENASPAAMGRKESPSRA